MEPNTMRTDRGLRETAAAAILACMAACAGVEERPAEDKKGEVAEAPAVAPPEPAAAAAAEAPKAWPPPVAGASDVEVTKADVLKAARVARLPGGEGAPLGAFDPMWKEAAYIEVPLIAQMMTMPKIDAASVASLRAQALTDGERVAIRVSWEDPQPDGNVDANRFTDAVAIQLPVGENPAPMMGHAGAKVEILHWKALWQKDKDVGFQDVQDLHPNYWSDLYWFAQGKFPYPIPASFKDPTSLQWFIAQQAGNPMAVFSRSQPVEELVAEGWGTLTHQPEAASSASGAWLKSRWAVVFSRPLKTQDPLDHQFGAKGQIAFAVWQGSAENVGGRKQWTGWNEYVLP